MDKKVYALPLATLIAIGITTGCGNNEDAAGNQDGQQYVPIGYYSNENHGNGGGNAIVNQENDGPFTEIMDHSFGTEGNQDRGINEPGGIRANQPSSDNKNEGLFNRSPHYSRSDLNYHGHLNNINGGARSSYYTAYEGDLMKKIANAAVSVNNVNDARPIIYKNKVILAAVLKDYHREKETVSEIRNSVEPYLGGRPLKIITNEGTYSRIRTIDNTLREGGPREPLDDDIKNIFQSQEMYTD